jgi:hypothetical protein
VRLLARDLREGKEFPRSPLEALGGYVFAARAVDKGRAVLAGCQGGYGQSAWHQQTRLQLES